MEKISEEFQNTDLQQAMKLAQTDAAKQLYALLQRTGGDQLQSAMDQVSAGNMDQARQTLQSLLSSDQAKELMRQLKGGSHG